jgi:hypothetical protein
MNCSVSLNAVEVAVSGAIVREISSEGGQMDSLAKEREVSLLYLNGSMATYMSR